MFTCMHALSYQRFHEFAEHGAEDALVGALVQELRQAGGVEEEEGQAPDGVGRHHPVKGPHQHGASLASLRTCSVCTRAHSAKLDHHKNA